MTDLYMPSEHHIRSYSANVTFLAQQEGSILSGSVRTDGALRGNRAMYDAFGKGTMMARTSRYADTYLADTARQRRVATIVDYERGELVMEEDLLKSLYDPKNPLAVVGANAAGVTKDQVIYNCLGASATEGNGDGSAFSTTALPSAQQLASSVGADAGMNFDKVRAANKVLKASGSWFMRMNGMNEVHGILSAAAEGQLLDQIEVNSSDHNSIAKDIVTSGSMDMRRWMGIIWHVLPDGVIAQNGSGEDLLYVYVKGAVGFATHKDIYTSFDRRADKSNAMQVLVKLQAGAVRIDDKGVVQIAADPTITYT